MFEEKEPELMEMDDEFFAFIVNNRSRLESVLTDSLIATTFEEQFGFPISLLPIKLFWMGLSVFAIEASIVKEGLLPLKRVEFFETKFKSLRDDNNTMDSFRSTFQINVFCVLHNICIDKGEVQFEPIQITDDSNIKTAAPEIIGEKKTNRAGRRRRDELLALTFGEDALQNDED